MRKLSRSEIITLASLCFGSFARELKLCFNSARLLAATFFMLIFTAGQGFAEINDPVILSELASAIGHVGASAIQINSYGVGFRNVNLIRLSSPQYLAEKEAESIHDHINMWVQQYSIFEKIQVDSLPSVSNVVNGTFMGIDTKHYESENGWTKFCGGYGGYTFGHHDYGSVAIYQNAATLGLRGATFKDSFYTALTASASYSGARDYNFFGSENFTNIMAGAALQSGYALRFFDDKLIIQPNMTTSYTFIQTFDYKSSTGAEMHSTPLHVIVLVPGIRTIANLKDGWQAYAGLYSTWGYENQALFFADGNRLPDTPVGMSFEYGAGVQRVFDERAIGFIQATFRSGARDGIGLSLGASWRI